MVPLKVHYFIEGAENLFCGNRTSRSYDTDPTKVTCGNCIRMMEPALDKLMEVIKTIKPRAKYFKPRKVKTGSRTSMRATTKSRKFTTLPTSYHYKIKVKVGSH